MRVSSVASMVVVGTAEFVNETATWTGVAFTHCGSGGSCGGHQHCTNYELAISDANIWRSLGLGATSGGYDTCPGGNWRDCCSGSSSGVCSKLPSCPLDSKSATAYPVCVKSQKTGKQETAYITGCCPYHHPCNICKAEKGESGACTQTKDQADLCDNLYWALGSPSQSTKLDMTRGKCAPAPAPPAPTPGPCADIAPDTSGTCAQQKGWGKCDRDWMKGYCCKTCFNCASGCGKFAEDAVTV